MQNFDYMTPTRLIFGKGAVDKLSEAIRPYGKRVLLAYGGGSIKKQGIYDFPKRFSGKALLMHLVGMLLGNEKILAKMGNKMNEGMIAPYEKMFKKLEKSKK